MTTNLCEQCRRTFPASRQSAQYCGKACRQKAYRKRKQPRQDLYYFEQEAKNAIYSIVCMGEQQGRRAQGTLKGIWIELSSQLLGLGVTRETLRELLIK